MKQICKTLKYNSLKVGIFFYMKVTYDRNKK